MAVPNVLKIHTYKGISAKDFRSGKWLHKIIKDVAKLKVTNGLHSSIGSTLRNHTTDKFIFTADEMILEECNNLAPKFTPSIPAALASAAENICNKMASNLIVTAEVIPFFRPEDQVKKGCYNYFMNIQDNPNNKWWGDCSIQSRVNVEVNIIRELLKLDGSLGTIAETAEEAFDCLGKKIESKGKSKNCKSEFINLTTELQDIDDPRVYKIMGLGSSKLR